MIIQRLRELREDKDLLQKDLASYLNCSQVAYSRYELGARDIPTNILIRLALFSSYEYELFIGFDQRTETVCA